MVFSDTISRHWATQPTTRATAKITVYLCVCVVSMHVCVLCLCRLSATQPTTRAAANVCLCVYGVWEGRRQSCNWLQFKQHVLTTFACCKPGTNSWHAASQGQALRRVTNEHCSVHSHGDGDAQRPQHDAAVKLHLPVDACVVARFTCMQAHQQKARVQQQQQHACCLPSHVAPLCGSKFDGSDAMS